MPVSSSKFSDNLSCLVACGLLAFTMCPFNFQRRFAAPVEIPGAVQMAEIVNYLDATLESDAILTNGAGNYSGFLHRFYKFKEYGTQLAPTSGSMGYGKIASWHVPVSVCLQEKPSGRIN